MVLCCFYVLCCGLSGRPCCCVGFFWGGVCGVGCEVVVLCLLFVVCLGESRMQVCCAGCMWRD